MAEQKSKFPDINELNAMVTKLFGDIKTSVCQILDDYKAKHMETDDVVSTESSADETKTEKTVKSTTKKVSKPKDKSVS